MGRRSCSLRPELARGRVMMAPPVDVAGLRPSWAMWKLLRSRGRVRAPGSGEAEIAGWCRGGVRALGSGEAEFVVFWGRAQVRALGRARRRSSSSRVEPKSEPWVGRGGDRRLLGPSPSPSPRSGEAEIVVFWGRAQVRALGRAEFAVFQDLARVRALGRAELAVFQDLA
jgi:hypothetical protein